MNEAVRSVAADKDREREISLSSRTQQHETAFFAAVDRHTDQLAAQRQGHEAELATFMAKFSNDRARLVLGRWACRLLITGFDAWRMSTRAAGAEAIRRHHAEELAAARTEAANDRARRVLGRWACRLLITGFDAWRMSTRAAGAEAIQRQHAEELAAARTENAKDRARRVLRRWTCRLLRDGFQMWRSSARAAGAAEIQRQHAQELAAACTEAANDRAR